MKFTEWFMQDTEERAGVVRRLVHVRALAMWPYTQPSDVDEVAQEVAIKALADDDADFQNEEALLSWLNVVIKNACIDERRRMKVRARRHPSPGDFEQLGAPDGDPLAEAIRSEMKVKLRDAVARLPARERRAVELVYFQGSQNQVAATQMGMSANAFNVMLCRARNRLAVLLNE